MGIALRSPRATRVWPNGYRVGELMATQSGRILLGALDRIVYSSANYWVAMLSDLAAALAFLALGLNRFSGPWVVAGGVVIVGFMSWGLLEYVVHRWVLHGPPSHGDARSRATPRRAQSAHQHAALRHHDRGAGHLGAARARASGRARRPSGLRAVCRIQLFRPRAPLATPSRQRPRVRRLLGDVSSDSITSITIDRS